MSELTPERAKALDRYRKLIAVAEDDPESPQSRLARSIAEALALKHSLEVTDLVRVEQPEPIEVQLGGVPTERYREQYRAAVLAALAEIAGCTAAYHPERWVGKVFGDPAAAVEVGEIYEELCAHLDTKFRKWWIKNRFDSTGNKSDTARTWWTNTAQSLIALAKHTEVLDANVGHDGIPTFIQGNKRKNWLARPNRPHSKSAVMKPRSPLEKAARAAAERGKGFGPMKFRASHPGGPTFRDDSPQFKQDDLGRFDFVGGKSPLSAGKLRHGTVIRHIVRAHHNSFEGVRVVYSVMGLPDALVERVRLLRRFAQEPMDDQPISLQLVPVPFAGKFEREDTQLELNGIEIITTPVIINPPPQ